MTSAAAFNFNCSSRLIQLGELLAPQPPCKTWSQLYRVANSLLSQELKLCFSDTKFTKAPYTKKDTRFFIDTK